MDPAKSAFATKGGVKSVAATAASDFQKFLAVQRARKPSSGKPGDSKTDSDGTLVSEPVRIPPPIKRPTLAIRRHEIRPGMVKEEEGGCVPGPSSSSAAAGAQPDKKIPDKAPRLTFPGVWEKASDEQKLHLMDDSMSHWVYNRQEQQLQPLRLMLGISGKCVLYYASKCAVLNSEQACVELALMLIKEESKQKRAAEKEAEAPPKDEKMQLAVILSRNDGSDVVTFDAMDAKTDVVKLLDEYKPLGSRWTTTLDPGAEMVEKYLALFTSPGDIPESEMHKLIPTGRTPTSVTKADLEKLRLQFAGVPVHSSSSAAAEPPQKEAERESQKLGPEAGVAVDWLYGRMTALRVTEKIKRSTLQSAVDELLEFRKDSSLSSRAWTVCVKLRNSLAYGAYCVRMFATLHGLSVCKSGGVKRSFDTAAGAWEQARVDQADRLKDLNGVD